jgi:hypothetical protein
MKAGPGKQWIKRKNLRRSGDICLDSEEAMGSREKE